MSQSIDHIVVLGGGTAGWLTACVLAAEFDTQAGVKVTLIESPSTPTIGVGEGTWPSMRSTLLKIGIPEKDFISSCSATMKQGTLFTGWLWGGEETYYHPFTLPHGFTEFNLAEHWSGGAFGQQPFASAVTPQFAVCEAGLAPKQLQVPDYAYTLNYGYHLDAAKFADLLRNHAVNRLGVRHVLTDVTGINAGVNGTIQSLTTTDGRLAGDFFVDCSGFRSLLLGEHYQVPLRSQRDILFNDSALAVQVPYDEAQSSIATTTRATAHQAGWFWDIGLQHRRGVGAKVAVGAPVALAKQGGRARDHGAAVLEVGLLQAQVVCHDDGELDHALHLLQRGLVRAAQHQRAAEVRRAALEEDGHREARGVPRRYDHGVEHERPGLHPQGIRAAAPALGSPREHASLLEERPPR